VPEDIAGESHRSEKEPVAYDVLPFATATDFEHVHPTHPGFRRRRGGSEALEDPEHLLFPAHTQVPCDVIPGPK
jgi:hypothetical protein